MEQPNPIKMLPSMLRRVEQERADDRQFTSSRSDRRNHWRRSRALHATFGALDQLCLAIELAELEGWKPEHLARIVAMRNDIQNTTLRVVGVFLRNTPEPTNATTPATAQEIAEEAAEMEAAADYRQHMEDMTSDGGDDAR